MPLRERLVRVLHDAARERPARPSRREVLALLAASFGSRALDRLLAATQRDSAADCPNPFAEGHFVGLVPFSGADRSPPYHTLIGRGLDARLVTDLSALSPDALVTPNERFFIRTAAPDRLEASPSWRIRVTGLVRHSIDLTIEALERDVETAGPYLIECAGNSDPANFGLMSAARWTGVPLVRVLERAGPLKSATQVRVTGFDEHSSPSWSSQPGASWVFPLDAVLSSRALLATGMNDEPLSPHHGAPVRLVVPGWYGCASVKWVTEIALVDDREPATAHMQEFATRTHQDGVPQLARAFKPATMDLAAMPVRVEKWIVAGRALYQIVGIVWGGRRPVDRLLIRFNVGDPWQPVRVCPPPVTTDTWTLWTYAWRPPRVGRYRIVLKAEDPSVRTTRLDVYFYAREIWIDEV